MEEMKIKYVVDGHEFKTESEAKSYLNNKLILTNAKFKKGDVVYHLGKDGFLHKKVISSVSNNFGKMYYVFSRTLWDEDPIGSYENKLFRTIGEYFDYIRNNIK